MKVRKFLSAMLVLLLLLSLTACGSSAKAEANEAGLVLKDLEGTVEFSF